MFSRDSSKALLALAIAALLALGLVACGGGDDSTQSTGGDATATTGGEKEADAGGSGSSGGSGSKQGSDSFLVPGGDNSIQEFGEEADSDELAAAEEVLEEYFDARAAKDWAKSCTLLSKDAVAPLEQLAEATPQLKGADCAEILGKVQGQLAKSASANPLTEGLAALRVEDGRAFALFHGAKGVDYFILMADQDGESTVSALAPSEFP